MTTNSSLLDAIAANDLDQVKRAIEEGANPDVKDEWGRPALYLAIGPEVDLGVLRFLLDQGASLEAADWSGEPLLRAAARFSSTTVVELLLDAGAVPDAGALAATLWNDRADSARLLLQRGCPVDATEEATGQTALHGAFAVGSHSVALVLKEHGADFNRVDKDGNTPLHLLAQFFIEEVHAPLVQLALEQGVDPLARNGAGLLATDLAPGLGVSPGQDEPR